jgi:energy-coupling factor transporter ATP-binding protein EcfA2|tara:strand:- start:2280 stop:5861 length:3582 start_codon:yes stop_codon:yes gene_type:complete
MSSKALDKEEVVGTDISELFNPFPGLRPFGVEETYLFFGREGQSDDALVKLAKSRFVAILGASGSGKSSFMYCGLIPSLQGGMMTEAGSNWQTMVSRPGSGPIDNLAESILKYKKDYHDLSQEDQLIERTIVSTVLRSTSLGLVEVIKQINKGQDINTLIVIDQFEELFRFSKLEAKNSDQNESAAFINLLIEAVESPEVAVYVTITMRSDFIGECAKYLDLTQLINDSHYLIPQMVRDQKRMAIEGPIAVGGGKIAPRLTQQLLNDVGDNPDQLPILQHALMRTWGYWVSSRQDEQAIDLEHYNAIGTLRQALSQHANEAFDLLNKRERQIAESMFKALTEKGAENTGIRRPTKLSTLAAISGVSEDDVERVVNRFREPGRSLLMPPHGVEITSETVIDISHESLMRIWDRLKQWLEEESKSADMYLNLSEAARRFQEGKASLWQMPDLQLAINWRISNRPTIVWATRYDEAFERAMVFLETSERAYENEQRNKALLQKRKVKNSRILALVFGALAVIGIFLTLYSVTQSNLAKDNAAKAKESEAAALISAEKAKEEEQKALSALEQARLAEREANIQRDSATVAQKRAEIAKIEAEIATREAVFQKTQADSAKVEAVVQRDNAVAQEKIAIQAQKTSEKLRYQAVAQSMALKARDVPDDQLRGVIAKQAYDYFIAYKEPDTQYNGDIYSGAYYGIKGLLKLDQYEKNREAGRDAAAFKADSAFNQYHGHTQVGPGREVVNVRSVTFSKDGSKMYSAGGDGRLLQWNFEDRSYIEVYSQANVNRVVNVSPNERWLALGTSEDEIDLFDLYDILKEPKKLEGHRGAVYDLVFFEEDVGFASVGADKKILLNNYNRSILLAELEFTTKTIAISPDGRYLAAGSMNGEVLLFDLEGVGAPKKIVRKDMEQKPILDVKFSHNGKFLAIGGLNITNGLGYAFIWDRENNKQYGPELMGFSAQVNDVEFSKNDSLFAASSNDNSVRFWDMDPDNIFDLPTIIYDHKGWVWDASFHPNGGYLVTAAEDGLLRRFPLKPDQMVDDLCNYITRNMSDIEWRQYVGDGDEIPWVETCIGKVKPNDEDSNPEIEGESPRNEEEILEMKDVVDPQKIPKGEDLNSETEGPRDEEEKLEMKDVVDPQKIQKEEASNPEIEGENLRNEEEKLELKDADEPQKEQKEAETDTEKGKNQLKESKKEQG